jgi:hypothetical protein
LSLRWAFSFIFSTGRSSFLQELLFADQLETSRLDLPHQDLLPSPHMTHDKIAAFALNAMEVNLDNTASERPMWLAPTSVVSDHPNGRCSSVPTGFVSCKLHVGIGGLHDRFA